METLDRKKNRDEYQSKKDAETDLADSDGRKIRISQTHMSNVEVGRAMLSLELLAAAEKYFRLYDRRTALSGR